MRSYALILQQLPWKWLCSLSDLKLQVVVEQSQCGGTNQNVIL